MAVTRSRRISMFLNIETKGERNLNELRKKLRRVKRLLNQVQDIPANSRRVTFLRNELTRLNGLIDGHQRRLFGINRSWQRIKETVKGAALSYGIYAGGAAIVGAARSFVTENAKISDSFADVQKKANLTDIEMANLQDRLDSINTRKGRLELLELASIAGKSGITGVENIEAFVRASEKIEVALGEDLGEDATKKLAKLNSIFKVSDIYGYEGALTRIGSVVNELDQSSIADAGFIVEFASKVAGSFEAAGFTIEQTLATASTLDIIGKRLEVSSTALGKLVIDMFRETELYAQVAGVSVEEFSDLIEKDAFSAMKKFLVGLNGSNSGLEQMVEKLDALGINGDRSIQVLTALSKSTATLSEQERLANIALEENISIQKEYDRVNNNLAASIEKIGKNIQKHFVNSGAVEWIGRMTSAVERWTSTGLESVILSERVALNKMVLELRNANTSAERRTEIFATLKRDYPDILGNIDAETASYEEQKRTIDLLSQSLIKKQQLALLEDEATKKFKDASVDRNAAIEREGKLQKALLAVTGDLNIQETLEGNNSIEQAENLIVILERMKSEADSFWDGSAANDAIFRVTQRLNEYKGTLEASNELEKEGNEILSKRADVEAQYAKEINDQKPLDVKLFNAEAASDEIQKSLDDLEQKAKDLSLEVALNLDIETGDKDYVELFDEINEKYEEILFTKDGLVDKDSEYSEKIFETVEQIKELNTQLQEQNATIESIQFAREILLNGFHDKYNPDIDTEVSTPDSPDSKKAEADFEKLEKLRVKEQLKLDEIAKKNRTRSEAAQKRIEGIIATIEAAKNTRLDYFSATPEIDQLNRKYDELVDEAGSKTDVVTKINEERQEQINFIVLKKRQELIDSLEQISKKDFGNELDGPNSIAQFETESAPVFKEANDLYDPLLENEVANGNYEAFKALELEKAEFIEELTKAKNARILELTEEAQIELDELVANSELEQLARASTDEENQIRAAKLKWKALIDLYKKFNLDVTKLEKARNSEVEALTDTHNKTQEKKTREATQKDLEQKLNNYNDFLTATDNVFSAMGDFSDAFYKNEADNAQFHKDLAKAQMAISQGVTMAVAMEKIAAGSLTGPQIIVEAAIILGSIASLYAGFLGDNESTDVPEYRLGTSTDHPGGWAVINEGRNSAAKQASRVNGEAVYLPKGSEVLKEDLTSNRFAFLNDMMPKPYNPMIKEEVTSLITNGTPFGSESSQDRSGYSELLEEVKKLNKTMGKSKGSSIVINQPAPIISASEISAKMQLKNDLRKKFSIGA